MNCYTGMPSFDVLNPLYRFVSPTIIICNSFNETNKIHQTSTRINETQTNPPLFNLAFRFKINKSSVFCIFNNINWIVVLSDRLSPLIHWPAREQLRPTMPFCYRRKYDLRLMSIIDCSTLRTALVLGVPHWIFQRSQEGSLTCHRQKRRRQEKMYEYTFKRIIGATCQTYAIISATAVVPWQYIQHDSNGHVLLDSIVRVRGGCALTCMKMKAL